MADLIHLSIVAADGSSWERSVKYVNIPTTFGSVGILEGHASMYVSVADGTVHCRSSEDAPMAVEVSSGVASVEKNEVSILVKRMKPAEPEEKS